MVLAAVIALTSVPSAAHYQRQLLIPLAIAAGAGAWTGLAAAVAATGQFANTGVPFPLIGAFVLFPILAVSAVAMLFPAVRTSLLAVPTSTLVGLNIARALGFFFFILLAWVDRLGGPFPQSAGWGDVITGVLAVAIMRFASQGTAGGDRAVRI